MPLFNLINSMKNLEKIVTIGAILLGVQTGCSYGTDIEEPTYQQIDCLPINPYMRELIPCETPTDCPGEALAICNGLSVCELGDRYSMLPEEFQRNYVLDENAWIMTRGRSITKQVIY
jgi:hypothetical protein